MRKLTSLAMIALMLVIGFTNLDAQPVKRVLLEQHTGAWCGWCVDGSYIMDELQKDYPDKLIGVKWHSGDAMQLDVYQELSQSLGVSGFPSGSVDRAVFNVGGQGAIMLSRSAWEQASGFMMDEAPKVEVMLDNWYYNSATNEVTIAVKCNVLEDIDNQIAFNALLCEDDVVGPNSSQWNQKNYLSGRSGYEDNPYYDKPSEIVGYVHEKVVRMNFASSIFGDEGTFPATVKAGETYSFSFTKELPEVTGDPIDLNNVFIVGFVANKVPGTNLQILNAVSNTIDEIPQNGAVTMAFKDMSNTAVVAPESSNDFTISVNNANNQARDFTLSIPDIPDMYNAVLSSNTLSIDANGTAEVTLNITTPAEPSAALIKVDIVADDNESVSGTTSLKLLNNNISNMVIDMNGTPDYAGYAKTYNNTEYNGFVNLQTSEILEYYSQFNNIKNIIWSAGEGNALTSDHFNILSNLIDNGANLVLSGNVATLNQDDAPSFLSKLGVKSTGIYREQSDINLDLEGVDGDPITDGWSTRGQLIRYLTSGFDISNSDLSSPVITYKYDPDTLAAFKTVIGDAKVVVFGFTPKVLDGQSGSKMQLLNNTMIWLNSGDAEPDGPSISLSSTSIDFGNTDTPVTETVTVTNTGDEDLVVSNMQIDGDGEFSVPMGNPVTIEPGGEPYDIEITYTPGDAGENTADLVLTTNDQENTEVTISLVGNSTVSVNDGIAGVSDKFTMSVGPNPVTSYANVTYSVNTIDAVKVDIDLIDVSGNKVMDVVNATKVTGEYKVQINSDNLSSGTYYLISNTNGVNAQLPVVIVK